MNQQDGFDCCYETIRCVVDHRLIDVTPEPRIVTPQEGHPKTCDCWDRHYTPQDAQRLIDRGGKPANPMFDVLALHTIAAEPDRTRAAVVKVLRELGDIGIEKARDWAEDIENGADI